ncbi:MAG: non-heme iron oxygenase ferredoxin subunit [Burkholderiales bacterium]
MNGEPAVANLIALCHTDDVWEGAIRQAVLPNGHRLALYQVDGQFYATDDTCTHGAASLSDDGTVEGHYVECGWHNGRFDVRTGEACAMPCTEPLRSWPVQVVDGKVCVPAPDSGIDPAAAG